MQNRTPTINLSPKNVTECDQALTQLMFALNFNNMIIESLQSVRAMQLTNSNLMSPEQEKNKDIKTRQLSSVLASRAELVDEIIELRARDKKLFKFMMQLSEAYTVREMISDRLEKSVTTKKAADPSFDVNSYSEEKIQACVVEIMKQKKTFGFFESKAVSPDVGVNSDEGCQPRSPSM